MPYRPCALLTVCLKSALPCTPARCRAGTTTTTCCATCRAATRARTWGSGAPACGAQPTAHSLAHGAWPAAWPTGPAAACLPASASRPAHAASRPPTPTTPHPHTPTPTPTPTRLNRLAPQPAQGAAHQGQRQHEGAQPEGPPAAPAGTRGGLVVGIRARLCQTGAWGGQAGWWRRGGGCCGSGSAMADAPSHPTPRSCRRWRTASASTRGACRASCRRRWRSRSRGWWTRLCRVSSSDE